jgi:outer membrane protein OmpA-like peptidoglycan-associated protein
MRIASVALATALAVSGAHAQAPAEPDPDSAEVHARARAALGGADRRPIKGEMLEIKGLALDVRGSKENVAGLLRELNAEVRGTEVRIALNADVLFDFDKAELKPAAHPPLTKVLTVLKSYPKATARIEGHTDSKGDDAYNQKLSERRADSVRRYLAAQGATLRMSTRGWGEKKPVAPNARPDGQDDPEGRSKNRRVEITLTQL